MSPHDVFEEDAPFGPLTQATADSRYIQQNGTGMPSSVVTDSSATPKTVDSTGIADRGRWLYHSSLSKWKARVPGPIEITDPQYGALGYPTDDTAAVQAAVTAAGAIYNSTGAIQDVVYPAGMKFTHGWIFPVNGVRIRAEGAAIVPLLSAMAGNTGRGLFHFNGSGLLTDFQIRGGAWLGTGLETNGQWILNIASGRGALRVGVEKTYVTNWGTQAFSLRSPTDCWYWNNRLDSIFGGGQMYNALDFTFDNSQPASGRCWAAHNVLTNILCDPLMVAVTSASVSGPLSVIMEGNICRGIAPRTDANCATTISTNVVTDASCVAGDLNKQVSGTGIPSNTVITAVTPGVSFTMSANATATNNPVSLTIGGNILNSGAMTVELDAAATVSDVTIANNNVTGYGTSGTIMAGNGGAGGTAQRVRIHNNEITNTANTGVLVAGTNPDVDVTDNRITAATPISGTPNLKSGNRYSTGIASGRATLVAGTVTVSTTEIQSGDNVILSVVSPGGTRGQVQLGTIVAGTSFVINSIQPGTASTLQTSDTSTVYWKIDH